MDCYAPSAWRAMAHEAAAYLNGSQLLQVPAVMGPPRMPARASPLHKALLAASLRMLHRPAAWPPGALPGPPWQAAVVLLLSAWHAR